MNSKVSIIIPCYNQGHYLMEALDSIKGINPGLLEVIIVNDGSTDPYTNELCKNLESQGWQVIWQDNKGLSAARNVGIRQASGNYILPLDADNKIRTEY